MGFIKNILKSIVHGSLPTYTFQNNALKFLVGVDKFYTYELNDYEMKTRHDPYVLEAYTLRNNQIHAEFIRTDELTTWNGLSRSFYESLLKEVLKAKTFQLLSRENADAYEFNTYKIDNTYTLHLIYIWENQKDIFIVDTSGELFGHLSKAMKLELPVLDKPSYPTVNLDFSLVKCNALQGFFNQSQS